MFFFLLSLFLSPFHCSCWLRLIKAHAGGLKSSGIGRATVVAYFFPEKYSSRAIFPIIRPTLRICIYRINMYKTAAAIYVYRRRESITKVARAASICLSSSCFYWHLIDVNTGDHSLSGTKANQCCICVTGVRYRYMSSSLPRNIQWVFHRGLSKASVCISPSASIPPPLSLSLSPSLSSYNYATLFARMNDIANKVAYVERC